MALTFTLFAVHAPATGGQANLVGCGHPLGKRSCASVCAVTALKNWASVGSN